MKITFLGTTSMFPTKERNHTSIFIRYKNEGILLDCGEGTQRQLKIAGIKPSQITKIIITHWHGDHVLGLPGLWKTLSKTRYEGNIKLYGQKGIKKRMKKIYDAFPFDNPYEFEIKEITSKKVSENDDLLIEAFKLNHNIPTLGYNFIIKERRKVLMKKLKKFNIPEGPLIGKLQKGKDIAFKGKKIKSKEVTSIIKQKKLSVILDTGLCKNIYKFANEADVIISDSTFGSEKEEMADEYYHLTSKQAAQVASQVNAKKLILTHFSQRYKDVKELLGEAKDIFPNTMAAYDFMKIEL